MRTLLIGLAALALTLPALAQQVIVERLVRARYAIVAVPALHGQLDFGGSLVSDPQDRAARVAMENALRDWKRYTVTPHPGQAELLFLVRTARSAALHADVGSRSSRRKADQRHPADDRPDAGDISGSEGGVTLGAEIERPRVDIVEVYALDDGKQGMLLWRGFRKNGLRGSPPPLLQEYRQKVENAAKKLGLP